MRIELNSGGLASASSIPNFVDNLWDLVSQSQEIINTFQKVTQRTQGMNGGAGNLEDAVKQIQCRKKNEETKKSAISKTKNKVKDFKELALGIDAEVDIMVSKYKRDFYKKYPWSKPPPDEDEKKYYEKAAEWIAEQCQQVAEALKNAVNTVIEWSKSAADTLSKAWKNAREWFDEHVESILKVCIAALVVCTLVLVITVAPFSVAFIATMGLVGAGVGIGINCIATASEKGLENMTFDDYADALFKGTVKGTASGISNGVGLMYGPGWRFVAGEVMNVSANLLIEETEYFTEHGTVKGSSELVWNAVYEGTTNNIIDSALFAFGFKLGGGKTINTTKMLEKILFSSDSFKFSILSDAASTLLNNTIRTDVNRWLNIEIPDSFDFVNLDITSFSDTIKGTVKSWFKSTLKPTEVY